MVGFEDVTLSALQASGKEYDMLNDVFTNLGRGEMLWQ
jgi:hypothetical protein